MNLNEKYNKLDKELAAEKRKLMDQLLPLLYKFKENTGFGVAEISIGWGTMTTGILGTQGVNREYLDNYNLKLK
jgi:hypothetical protein